MNRSGKQSASCRERIVLRAGVVLVYRNFVLVVKQRQQERYATTKGEKEYWNYPKGHAKDGETDEGAAVRELREETGIVISENNLGMQYSYIRREQSEECTFFISFIHPDREMPQVKVDPTNAEIQEVKWVDFRDFTKSYKVSKPTKGMNLMMEKLVDQATGVNIFDCWNSAKLRDGVDCVQKKQLTS